MGVNAEMKNIFPVIIVAFFFGAATTDFFTKNYVRGLFYLFSALLNITTMLM